MRSGTMPWMLYGMSSCRKVTPQVPFWPCRLANLSPICGMRTDRMRACATGASCKVNREGKRS